jgi:hypothetical protein
MSGEEYLAHGYCEPKAYWHCLHGLVGGKYYTYNEINFPEYWLDAVAKYIRQTPSSAAKQLHRAVEAARAEVRVKQNKIYGARKVSETEGLEEIYRREDKGWDVFNAHKRDCLRVYLKAIRTGKIEKQRARRRHRCQGEVCSELLTGRARFCDSCKRARNREAARIYRRRNQSCSVISYTREISPKNRAFGYRGIPYRGSRGPRQGKATAFTRNRNIKMPQPATPINAEAREGGIYFSGMRVIWVPVLLQGREP